MRGWDGGPREQRVLRWHVLPVSSPVGLRRGVRRADDQGTRGPEAKNAGRHRMKSAKKRPFSADRAPENGPGLNVVIFRSRAVSFRAGRSVPLPCSPDLRV
jgi:hypothetical protein